MSAPLQMPSCPRCALNDRVITPPPPEPRKFGPLLDAPAPHPFDCGRCNLPFSGTDAEYVRMTDVRQKYRDSKKPRSMPDGVR